MGPSVKYTGKGGGHIKGFRGIFKGGCSGGTYLLVRDMDNDPPYGPVPGGVLEQGGHTYNWEATKEEIGW